MSLDPNIALQVKPVQFENPLAQMAQFSQIQGLQNQNQLAQYTLSKARRDDEDTIAQRNLLTGAGGDLEAGYNALLKGGYLDRALAIKKAQQEQDKTKSEIGKNNATTAKTQSEVAVTKMETLGQTMGALAGMPNVTPQMVANAIQHHADMFGIPADKAQASIAAIPQDPQGLRAYLVAKQQEVAKVADQMKYTTADANAKLASDTSIKVGEGNNRTALAVGAASNQQSDRNSVRSAEVSREGQNAPQFDADRGVIVDKRTGTSRAVTGADGLPLGAKDKALTETQGKATGFAARAQQADKLIASLDYSPAAINSKASVENTPMVGGMLGALVNSTTLSSSDQRAEQAQRDFINAVLRQESGAAIGKDEFTNARKQYFPQPGDDAETLTQKAANRKLAVEALRTQAGPGAKQIDGMIDTSNKPAAKRVEEAVKNGEVTKLVNAKPVSVKSAADYAKLPSGTVYTAPDGSQRTKQ